MTPHQIDSGLITVVNVFEIEMEKLDTFLELWRDRAEILSRQPGFRSLRLLRAVSIGARFQLVIIHEWDSVDALHETACRDWFQQGARRAVEALNVSANPGIYQAALEITAPRVSM